MTDFGYPAFEPKPARPQDERPVQQAELHWLRLGAHDPIPPGTPPGTFIERLPERPVRKPRKPMGELGRLAWAWGSGAAFGFALANLLRVVLS